MTDAEVLRNVPFNEKNIPFKLAEKFIEVSDGFLQLEGLTFDAEGNLWFCDVFQGGIYIVPKDEKKAHLVCTLEGRNPSAVKAGPDGRLYICCLGDMKKTGGVVALNTKTLDLEEIIPISSGYVVDDMCFDGDGFFFTHFTGHIGDLSGGIYRADIEGKRVRPFLLNLNTPNGLAISGDKDGLWISEMGENRLLFVELGPDRVSVPPYGSMVPYKFTGRNGPDSVTVSQDGTLYVAMYNQGRVMAFNKMGLPIGQILLPGSWDGHYLRSTHPKETPDGKKILITANDFQNGGGSWIFIADAF